MKTRTVSLKSNSLSLHIILSAIFLIIFTSNSGILPVSVGIDSFSPKLTKIRRILDAVFFPNLARIMVCLSALHGWSVIEYSILVCEAQ